MKLVALFFALILSYCTPPGMQVDPVPPQNPSDTPGGPVGKRDLGQPVLFVASGSNVSAISLYDANGNKIRDLPVPQGIVGAGGLTTDSAGTLYAVSGHVDHTGQQTQTAYAFDVPYAAAVAMGNDATALVDDPVTLCAPAPDSMYLVNQGSKESRENGWDTASVLFTDPHNAWTMTGLPNREQSGNRTGGGRDEFGNCYFPGARGVEQYIGGNTPVSLTKYRGSIVERGMGVHGSIAVGPTSLAIANNREIDVYTVTGSGSEPTHAYKINRPWPETWNHVGGAFSRMAYDQNGILYSAHAHYSRCYGDKACYWDTAIFEYRPGETEPFLRARLPQTCEAGAGPCLDDMAVSSDGTIYALMGRHDIDVYKPGHSQPSIALKFPGFISAIYAVQ